MSAWYNNISLPYEMLQLEFYFQYQDQRQAINYLWSYDFEFLHSFLSNKKNKI